MANLRIGHRNYADLATITANPTAATGSAVTYLQNDSRGDVFIAGTTSAQEIKLTWNGTAYDDIRQITLWRHNAVYVGASGPTIAVVFYSDAAWTTAIGGSTIAATAMHSLTFNPYFVDWGWGFANLYFTAPAGVKSIKITVVIAVVPALQAMRLYVGPFLEAPIQIAEGAMVTPESNSVQTRAWGGSLRSRAGAKWRALNFDMLVVTEADRAAWYEVARYLDNVIAFPACIDPGGGTTLELHGTVFGKFEKAPGVKLGSARYDFSNRILEG